VKIKPTTEEEKRTWPTEPLVKLEAPFLDDRGGIQPLVDVDMQSAVMISSKCGTVRANHYHQTDWHYCYIVEGGMDYYHRPHGSTSEPEILTVGKGAMVWTPPLVDHAMKFTSDTLFLTLGRNPRDQETYEADVVRITPLVEE
jgi:dTDP-4-dehydrorhamnose 3,5-epimerase-like enzyme